MRKKYLKSKEEFIDLVFERINKNLRDAGQKEGGALTYEFTSNEDLLKFIKYFGYLSKDQIALWLYDYADESLSEVEISKNLFYKLEKGRYYFKQVSPALKKI